MKILDLQIQNRSTDKNIVHVNYFFFLHFIDEKSKTHMF